MADVSEHSQIQLPNQEFWRWCFKRYWNIYLVRLIIAVGFIQVGAQVYEKRWNFPSTDQKEFWSNPFFVTGFVIFACSYIILDYMEFRLTAIRPSKAIIDSFFWRLFREFQWECVRQGEIPKQYRVAFGKDICFWIYRLRVSLVVVFFIVGTFWIIKHG